ncbi:hypothetical protein PHET_07775 [Paragonimus heterotremus]|uniref:MANSC domain-containing protein n=1 Tax=Paragonimus heterotremus TaxID=100268 RepID=A0A8J4WFY8_9TREM|nr:hypothetical protein PHET_07775 [Paragonimus heterotremus]
MFRPSWLLLLFCYHIVQVRLLETCERTVQLKTNTIILPRQDSDTGVEFLKKLPVRSLKECYTTCCNLGVCTRAVYKSKVSKECFLFNCTRPESCVYKAQANYDVVILTSRTQESYHQVELGGSCDPTHTCATNHSECSNGQCVCQSGWVTKDLMCASTSLRVVPSVCKTPDLQFQCNDASMCVAVYDKCNGVIECPDGSDETGCPIGLPTTSASTDFRSQNSSSGFYRKTSNNLTDNFEKTKPLDYVLHTPNSNLNAAKDDEIWERNEFSSDRQAQNYLSQKLSDVERDPPNRMSPDAFHIEQSRPRMLSSSRFSGSQPYRLSPRLNTARTRLLSDPPMHPTHWYTKDSIWDPPDRPSATNDIFVQPVHYRPRYPPYLLEDVVDQNNLYSLPPRGYARDGDGFSFDGFQSPRPYLERHKIYTDRSSSEPRSDNYVNYARAHHHDRKRVRDAEELVDPSVLSGLHAQDWDDLPPKYRGRAWPAQFREHVYEEHPVAHITSRKNEHPAVEKKKEGAPPTPPSIDSEQPANDAVLTAFQRSQSEGHTAALILAFSLGLMCCFISLLIVEWRRRHRLQPFRRRPTMPVLFGDRGKLTVIRDRSGRRGKQVIRDMNNPVGTEDENKALCDELVL